MTRWRIAAVFVLALVVGMPIVFPLVEGCRLESWQAWSETGRLASLLGNSLELLAGTLLLALPVGVSVAILLFRTTLPARRFLRFVIFLTLFVPLPLLASAWQAAFGDSGWLPALPWSESSLHQPWAPWIHGVGAAIGIHAIAGLPWVVVLVGHGLLAVEPELEEEALLATNTWRVLWQVTLPRCRAALGAAALWIGLQTMTEITVTDMLQVRTFAEEVYTEMVVGDANGPARAMCISLPVVFVTWIFVVWTARSWDRQLPAAEGGPARSLLFSLGWARWPAFIILALAISASIAVPVLSLVWKMGLGGTPPSWSASVAVHHFQNVLKVRGFMVAQSVGLALGTGLGTAAIALTLCWLAVESGRFRVIGWSVLSLGWALAAPAVGLGLKSAIQAILRHADVEPVSAVLYDGPSPVPILWAHLIRFLPCAVAVLWPVVRLLPRSYREAARIDGATPWQELRRLYFPLTSRTLIWAASAVAVLSLGELGASKLVATPGWPSFAHEIFTQMHYGISNDLAALCLILLGLVILGGGMVAALGCLRIRSG